jgi:hypothetical protein
VQAEHIGPQSGADDYLHGARLLESGSREEGCKRTQRGSPRGTQKRHADSCPLLLPPLLSNRSQVKDNAGESASVTRTIKILPRCKEGEELCPDNECSKGGLCKGASTAVKDKDNQAPVIRLVTTESLTSTVNLMKGTPYLKCAAGGVLPTESAPCDLGATALDEEDGDLTTKVRTRSRACMPPGMRGCSRGGLRRAAAAPLNRSANGRALLPLRIHASLPADFGVCARVLHVQRLPGLRVQHHWRLGLQD